MTDTTTYIIQLGTRWDTSQNLVWAPLSHPVLQTESLIVPRPRTYRNMADKMLADAPLSGSAHEYFKGILKTEMDAISADKQILLGMTSLMQPVPYFCPAGDWFFGLGERVQHLLTSFEPNRVFLMLSPQNPAVFLSNAWESGSYTGFEDVPPDPFDLLWSDVVSDIHLHNPDAQIVVCPTEKGPLTWAYALQALCGISDDETKKLQRALALYEFNPEGKDRFNNYFDDDKDIPLDLHSRIVESFLKAYGQQKKPISDFVIPNWTEEKNEAIGAQYAADLAALKANESLYFIDFEPQAQAQGWQNNV